MGFGLLLVLLGIVAMAGRQLLGWGLAPHAKAWVDAGDPPAPIFSPGLSGPLPSLQVSQGGFVSEAHYPEPAG